MLVSDQAPASPGWAPCPNPLLAHECRFAGMNQTFEEKRGAPLRREHIND
jgi:hypothetical protein